MDIIIAPRNPITNFKIVSEIKCELADSIDIDKQQMVLAKNWKPYMSNLDCMVCDATCYESAIRYPTDIKLLWEATEWNYKMLVNCSQILGKRRPRTKFNSLINGWISLHPYLKCNPNWKVNGKIKCYHSLKSIKNQY